jgi:hypothetical protein
MEQIRGLWVEAVNGHDRADGSRAADGLPPYGLPPDEPDSLSAPGSSWESSR